MSPALGAEQARVLAKGPFPDYPFVPRTFVHPVPLYSIQLRAFSSTVPHTPGAN